ncbi:hypothetical protein GS435_00010 [Rhodococcus hoagii]|nr:hypothetical protein [Prescottella equi]
MPFLLPTSSQEKSHEASTRRWRRHETRRRRHHRLDLPGDLTGQVVTIDLRHVEPGQDAGAAALLSELIARGAARLVVEGTDAAHARTLIESAQHSAPPSGLAA